MLFTSSARVFLLIVTSISFAVTGLPLLAQPGALPGAPPIPPRQGAPHPVTPAHPAANIPGPIARLPRGAQEIDHRGHSVFHHDGNFFARQGSGYRSITPPVGLELKRLPNRAKRVARDLYRYNDVYYEKVGINQHRITTAP